jgi:tetratricopeptide (TPR) repeat protein
VSRRAARLPLLLPLPLLLLAWDWPQTEHEAAREGNRRYQRGHYEEAVRAYRGAQGEDVDPARVHFAIGAALYKQATEERDTAVRDRLLDEAELEFRRAADTRDAQLKSWAYHNLGNTMYLRGLFGAAMEAYKKALRANPHNEDARYNLELALRRRRQGSGSGDGAAPQGQDGGESPAADPGVAPGLPPPGAQRPDRRAQDTPPVPPRSSAGPAAPPPGASPPAPRAAEPGAGQGSPARRALSRNEFERKFDALERRSRQLRARRLRQRAVGEPGAGKDH